MPSKTPKQAKFMRAVAHGWNPSRMKSPPSRAVAQEFVEADRKYSGGFAENRYWRGGLAAMDSPTAGYKGRIDWQEGGNVDPQLQRRIGNTLGSAQGGHVNYYEEGGEVRPGHAEGKNPHDQSKTPGMYGDWERRYHEDPPVEAPEVEPETLNVWERLARFAKAPPRSDVELAELEAAEMGNAYGGRVRYQTGGLAIAAPAGGVPPWITPTGGLDTQYMDPQGYQFGGAARMGGARNMMRNYRGVPPQRGGIQRGAPPGGGRPGMFGSRWGARQPGPDPHQGRGAPGGGSVFSRFVQQANEQRGQQQGGGLAAMMRRARGQQTYQDVVDRGEGGINPIMDESGRRLSDITRPTGSPGGGGVAPGNAGTLGGPGYGEYPLGSAGPRMDPSDPRYRAPPPPGGGGMMLPGGGMYTDPNHPNYSPPGSGGSFDMSGKYTPPTSGFLAGHDPTGGRPWGGGGGKPGRGIIPLAGGEGGGPGGPPTETIMPVGGPRVPPNMRGYLQKQRMMNRPPANVGGGANRVGMQDQQGALSRAMQRGTGRAPPSRRFGRGRAGSGRGFQQP